MKRIICLGIAVLDQIFTLPELPRTAGKHFAEAYLEVGGGPAATAAVTIARLGGQVEFWGRVGDDLIGDRIVGELQQFGVDVSQVRRIRKSQSSVSAVLVDRFGERLIVNRANSGLDPDPSWLPLERLADCDAVLVDSRWIQGAQVLLEQAKSRNILSVLDADSTPNEDIAGLVGLASHTAFSKNGLSQVTGTDDFETALQRVANQSAGWVCATRGEEGTYWIEDGGIKREAACKVDVVDTLGAGDVFHGALVFALARGLKTDDAVRFSNAAAALKCRKLGGRAGIPDIMEVEELIDSAFTP
ncbi:MAG: sugar kinase [Proteobacteria bacterium]|nr:sugar kinase [Pseudomonadota bacterium]